MIRSLTIALVLFVAVMLLNASVSGAATANSAFPGGNPAFGVNATSSVIRASDADARRVALADIADLGVRFVRIDVTWSAIEPLRGVRDWSFYDAVMADVRYAGLEAILLIGYGNVAYGSATSMAPPPDSADYADFAGAVAQRYRSVAYRCHVYQVWNEPNLAHFWGGSPATPAQYLALLAPAYESIHAADPRATVLSAGIAPSGMTAFVSGLYAAGGRQHFDALAIHPYIGEGADSMWDVRTVMNANGDTDKRVWATEFGWSTWDTPGNSEALQASRFSQAVGWWRDAQQGLTGPFVAYTHRDTGSDPANPEHWFGLARADGSHKPAWATFRGIAEAG